MQSVIHISKVSGGTEVRGAGSEEGSPCSSLCPVTCSVTPPSPDAAPAHQSEPLGGLVCLEAGVLQQWLRVSVESWAVQATAVLSTRRFRWMTVVLEGMEVLPLSADQWSQWNRIRKHL